MSHPEVVFQRPVVVGQSNVCSHGLVLLEIQRDFLVSNGYYELHGVRKVELSSYTTLPLRDLRHLADTNRNCWKIETHLNYQTCEVIPRRIMVAKTCWRSQEKKLQLLSLKHILLHLKNETS